MTTVKSTIHLGFKEISEALDLIIGQEVHNMYSDLINIAEDIHVTRAFKKGFIAPRKINAHDWKITNTAPHAIVLAQGRHTINGKAYGSLGWYRGIDGNLIKLKADIQKRWREVKA